MWRLPAALLAIATALILIGPVSATPPCDRGQRVCPTPTQTFWPTPDPTMGFPTVADADTKNGTVTSNSTSWTVTYPTNIAANDALILFLGMDGNNVVPSATGFEQLGIVVSPGAVTLAALVKKAAGTETGTFTVTLSASEQGGWRIFRIPAASYASAGSIGAAINSSTGATATSGTTPDPDSLDPLSWDVEDTLWFAAMAADTSRTVSDYPDNYTNTAADVSGGSGGATLATARRELRAASEDPNTFTISASDDWAAFTVGVRGTAAAARVPRSTPYPQILAH